MLTIFYQHSNIVVVHAVIVNKEEDTPLSLECSRGSLDWVKALIGKHVDLNGEHYFQARLIVQGIVQSLFRGDKIVHGMYDLIIQTALVYLYTGNNNYFARPTGILTVSYMQ